MDTQPFALSFPDSLHGTCFPAMEANTFAPLGLGTKQWMPWVSAQWGFQDTAKLLRVIWSRSGAKPQLLLSYPALPFAPLPPHSVSFQCLFSLSPTFCKSKWMQPHERGGIFPFLAHPSSSSPPRALALPSQFQFWMITGNSRETIATDPHFAGFLRFSVSEAFAL